MDTLKNKIISILKNSERYTGTDMVYVAKNTFWINANTIIITILSFILSLLFANMVSKETYGNYQFLISTASLLSAFTLTGMNAAVTQAVARGLEGVFNKSVKIQVKYSLIPLTIGTSVAGYYFLQNNTQLAYAILVVSLLLPLTNALNTWGAFLSGKQDFKSAFFYNQISNLIYYGSIILTIILFPSALTIVCVSTASMFIGNSIIYFIVQRKYKPNKNTENEAIDYGKKLSLSSILPMITLNIDNILVFHLLGATDLAIYAFASNIPERFMSLLRPISSVAFPKLSEKTSDEIKEILPIKIKKFLMLAFVFGAIYIVSAPFIYKYMFPQYSTSIFYSQIYIFVAMISTVSTLSITALFASRSDKIFRFNIVNPIFSICLVIIGGYIFGIWGIILGRLISSTFALSYSYILQKN